MQQAHAKAACDTAGIRLDAGTVFNLLLFAGDEGVRDAAAHALSGFVRVEESLLSAHDCALSSLVHADRIAALLVASMFDDSVGRKGLFGAMPHADFKWAMPAPAEDGTNRLFRLQGGHRPKRSGGSAYRIPDTFVLPKRPEDLYPGITGCYRSRGHWEQRPRGRGILTFGPRKGFSRACKGWQVPQLVDPDGVTVCTLPDTPRNPLSGPFMIDAGVLFRMAAGQLDGHIVSYRYWATSPRRQQLDMVAVSLELGDLEREAPLLVGFKGSFESQLDIERRLAVPPCVLPPLGGATVRCLDAIARRVGVRHGSAVRGSFAYHPLHASRILPTPATTDSIDSSPSTDNGVKSTLPAVQKAFGATRAACSIALGAPCSIPHDFQTVHQPMSTRAMPQGPEGTAEDRGALHGPPSCHSLSHHPLHDIQNNTRLAAQEAC